MPKRGTISTKGEENVRLRTEIDENGEEEIVIRARVCDESLMRLLPSPGRSAADRNCG